MFTIEWRLALVVCVILPILLIVVITRQPENEQGLARCEEAHGRPSMPRSSPRSPASARARPSRRGRGVRQVQRGQRPLQGLEAGVPPRGGHFLPGSLEFFLSILSVAVITVGGTLIMQGRMDLVDLFTFSLYISTFTSPVRKLVNFAEMFANGFAGLGRFVELMRTGAEAARRAGCESARACPRRDRR